MDPGLNNAGGPAIRDDGIVRAVIPVYSFYRPANAFFTVIPERFYYRHSSVPLAGIQNSVVEELQDDERNAG